MNLVATTLWPQSEFLPQLRHDPEKLFLQVAFLNEPPLWLVVLDCPALNGDCGCRVPPGSASFTEGPFKNRC